ncbi:MAG TPA: GyrI-like domain-containing protein [Cellulomonas sp.]
MTSLVKFDVLPLPALKVVGRAVRVRMADEMDDPVPELWARCHGDGTLDELEALDTFDPSPVGWMGDFDAKTSSFVYLCGVLLPSDAPVPDGYDARAIGPTSAAVGWVQGEPDELVPLAQELTEEAMAQAGVAADDSAGWALELYNAGRFTEPGPDGEVVLDFYIPCLEPATA